MLIFVCLLAPSCMIQHAVNDELCDSKTWRRGRYHHYAVAFSCYLVLAF